MESAVTRMEPPELESATTHSQSQDGIISRGVGIRISQKLNVMAFWTWNIYALVFQSSNLNVVAFHPLKKCLGITMLWLCCLRFSMLQFLGLGI